MAEKQKAPRRTPAEIAQEKYDGAKGRLSNKKARLERLTAEVEALKAEVEALTAEVEYLSKHPALPQPDEVADGDDNSLLT